MFVGCTTPYHLPGYEAASRAVLETLGVALTDVPAFKCCGYPFKNVDIGATVLASATNLALAQTQDLDVVVLCKCGYGTMKQVAHMLDEDASLQEQVNRELDQDGLHYSPGTTVMHLLEVLHKVVGVDHVKAHITRPYTAFRVAPHYGCHALRPSEITGFDDPVAPVVFDDLVATTGAQSVDWPEKLACCGGPIYPVNETLAMDLAKKKLTGAAQAEAHVITTACPFCQLQFERLRRDDNGLKVSKNGVSSIVYPQLLGFAMGLDPERLGIGARCRQVLERFIGT